MGQKHSQPIKKKEDYEIYWGGIQNGILKEINKPEFNEQISTQQKEKNLQQKQQKPQQKQQTPEKKQNQSIESNQGQQEYQQEKKKLINPYQIINEKMKQKAQNEKNLQVSQKNENNEQQQQKQQQQKQQQVIQQNNVSLNNNNLQLKNQQQQIQQQTQQKQQSQIQDVKQQDKRAEITQQYEKLQQQQESQFQNSLDIQNQPQKNEEQQQYKQQLQQQYQQKLQYQSQQQQQYQYEQQQIQQNQNSNNNFTFVSQVFNSVRVKLNEECILKRCFMIDTNELRIGKLSAQILNQFQSLTSEIILNQIFQKVLTTNELANTQKVTWFIKALINLSDCEIQQTSAFFYEEGSISKDLWMKMMDAVLDKIVLAVSNPQKLSWVSPKEDINVYSSKENQIATHVYQLLFGQQIIKNQEVFFEDLNHPALNYLFTYLDTKCQTEDALNFLDLICKRELQRCQFFDLRNYNKQSQSLELLDKFSQYPKITELLFQNSWAYGKFQQFTTGRDLQRFSIFGSMLSLSTFPRDFPEVISVLRNQSQSLQINKECFRGIIYDFIFKMADIFLRIIRRGKQSQLQLFTYICKLIEINLDINKVNQKEKFDKCCFQGMMFNLQQILLEIFNPFIYNNQQAIKKVGKINRDLLAYIKYHPLLAKIYQNAQQLAPQIIQFNPLDNYPDIDPMTFLYLLVQKINGLQQSIIEDYALLYVNLQYDKKIFGNYSILAIESQIDKALFDTLLLHPKSIQNTIQFLSFQCKVALSMLDENNEPQYPYGLLCNSFLKDCFNYCFIYNSNDVALDYIDEIISICEFTILTMSNNKLNEDINLRIQGMDLFYIFNNYISQQNSKSIEKSRKIFQENKTIRDYLIEGLITAYVDHDRVKISNIIPAERFKSAISQLLLQILTNYENIYVKKFLEYIKMNSNIYQRFAVAYINDIKEMIDQCMAQTKKLKLEEDIRSNQPLIPQNREQLLKDIIQCFAENRCLHDWKCLEDLFQNIILFTKIEPKAFLIEETRQQFGQNLNYILELLNSQQNIIFLNSKFLKKCESQTQPQYLSNRIVQIFVNLKSQSIFWDEIALNNSSLQVDLLYKLGTKLNYQKMLPSYQIQQYFQILFNLEQIKIDYNQILGQLSQEPDREQRYLDCLTNNLMSDPVMLPNSRQIVDKVTIKRILLNKQEDPFDRSFLNPEMIIEQPELKQEIRQYLDEKKQEMKHQRQRQI